MGDKDLTPTIGRDQGRFVKGMSGNPTGKSLSAHNFAHRCRVLSPRMLELAVAIAEDNEHPQQFSAIKFVVERAHGKPIETVDVTTTQKVSWAALALEAQKAMDAKEAITVIPTEVPEAETVE